ncbi:hypothetical protein HRI_003909400 [Hibiscus trionum]|uniref:Uncharacterized protein n=1 Tax=Hibiscus trionum TaxID=183268 RepID=A0A9W7IWI8_HIBTR|nr:hypothetical protein HRI_003909400 [Hibiscus trionum]
MLPFSTPKLKHSISTSIASSREIAMASSINHRVIIIVLFSCGGFIFLACAAVALYCFLYRKKKVEETDLVHVDEHLKVKEAVVSGPHGPHAVVIGIEDDFHVTEDIVKTEKVERGSRLGENPKALEAGVASSSSDHLHQLEHKA